MPGTLRCFIVYFVQAKSLILIFLSVILYSFGLFELRYMSCVFLGKMALFACRYIVLPLVSKGMLKTFN